MAFTDSSYGLFQGQFFIAERAFNGKLLGGFEFVGDVDMFTIDPKQKFDNIEESQTGLGLTAAHIITGTEVMVKFRALDIKMSNWVRATWGTTQGSVPAEVASTDTVVLYNGQMTPLSHPGVSNVVVAGATLGTDYTLDAVNGSISVLASSPAIPSGTPLTAVVTYDHSAYAGKVQAFTTGQRYYSTRLQGRNTAQGNQPVIVNAHQIAFDMAKVFNMIEKKHFNMEMDGMMLQDTSKPLPSLPGDLSQFFEILKA